MSHLHLVAKAEVAKVDETLGLVYGWAIICTEKGEPHYDLQGDHIPEPVMTSAASDFMKHSRVAKEMHTGEQIGTIVHSFTLTTDIAKAMNIQTEKTGWMVAMQPDDPAILEKFRNGELTGFSIGGTCEYEFVELQEAA